MDTWLVMVFIVGTLIAGVLLGASFTLHWMARSSVRVVSKSEGERLVAEARARRGQR